MELYLPKEIQKRFQTESARFNTLAGYGSTATRVPYYTEEVENDISELGTIVNDSTNGWSFTSLTKVKVEMNWFATSVSDAVVVGISLDSSNVAIEIQSLPQDEILDMNESRTASSIRYANSSISGFILEPGQVLRPQTNGNAVTNVSSLNIRVTKIVD